MSYWGNLIKALLGIRDRPGLERPSPGDWLRPEEITFYDGVLRIDLKPLSLLRLGLRETLVYQPNFIPDTNSMDPVFDFGHNLFLVKGASSEDHVKLVYALEVGDIAVYQTSTGVLVHRIVAKDFRIYTFRGDNNAGIKDPYQVRPENILFVSLGDVY